ncbi:HAD hydrolase-like protein [Microbacterium sp. BWT-B31]|uniref:HAD-IIA family hydrolase n=1 Tax=Microbacterium sp. BWT-B31 TaxID=3232072 RepID=UPI00352987F3
MTRELGQIRGWVFDVDGCLVRTDRAGGHGGEPMPGARELLISLLDAGHRIVVCTNASELAPATYAAHLRGMGLPVRDEDFVTAGSAVAEHVFAHDPGARVLAIGGEGISTPLRAIGLEVVEPGAHGIDAVVVGAASSYSADDLNAGALAVDAGAAFYTTVATPWFSGGKGRSLAVSAAVAASITFATGRTPLTGGKPSPVLAEGLLRRLGLSPEVTAVVGDATAETRLARSMGATAILVLSGATARDELDRLEEFDRPDVVLDDVAVLQRRLAPHLTTQGAAQ